MKRGMAFATAKTAAMNCTDNGYEISMLVKLKYDIMQPCKVEIEELIALEDLIRQLVILILEYRVTHLLSRISLF